jgi:hypothetical protein
MKRLELPFKVAFSKKDFFELFGRGIESLNPID